MGNGPACSRVSHTPASELKSALNGHSSLVPLVEILNLGRAMSRQLTMKMTYWKRRLAAVPSLNTVCLSFKSEATQRSNDLFARVDSLPCPRDNALAVPSYPDALLGYAFEVLKRRLPLPLLRPRRNRFLVEEA